MPTQKRFFVNDYGPTAGKVTNLVRGHKHDKDKMFVYFPIYGALQVDQVLQPREECTI